MADPKLVALEEDGPLGPAGTQVWVNDPADAQKTPAKKAATRRADGK